MFKQTSTEPAIINRICKQDQTAVECSTSQLEVAPGAPHNGRKHPPRGRPSATPTASNAGPQGLTLWGR